MAEGSLPFDGGYGTGPAPDIDPEYPGFETSIANAGWRHLGLPAALLILFALFGGVAIAILPDNAPLQQPQPFSVEVGDALRPEKSPSITLNLELSNPKPNVTEIGLTLGNLRGNVVSVTIDLPMGVSVTACHGTYRPATRGEVCNVYPIDHITEADLTLPVRDPDNSGFLIAAGAIEISSDHFGVDSDGVTAEAAIPTIVAPASPDGISVAYQDIPKAASYDWSGNSIQLEDTAADGASWIVPTSSSMVPLVIPTATDVTGTNHDAQKRQNLEFFLSGALIGLAGAALIGAVQEFFHGRRSA